MTDPRPPGLPGKEAAAYFQTDLARKYPFTRSEAAAQVPEAVIAADLETVRRDGYLVIPSLLSHDELGAIRDGVAPLLGHAGRNDFEGVQTQRVYAVLEKTRALDGLVAHPRILALLDRMFLPNYLLSQAQVINIQPGEQAQALHTDDAFYAVPRPRPPLGAATVWAIDPFTADNGATVIVPRSHTWGDQRTPRVADGPTPATMPAGSVVFYPGTLWHGGGENRTPAPRLAITCQYCEPWVRTQENYSLSVSRETVRVLSEDLKRLLGYSIHPPFMGMVNGMHPKRLLEDDAS
ncbi:MAG: phytanoyl-CoA dioxygenase family protein [Myxococcota bacterium]